MNDQDTINAFDEKRFPVNPPLPDEFDNTPNNERPKWEIDILWGRPYIEIMAFTGNPKYKKEWLEAWPSGQRFDVRCLDGGAWDRPTVWGMFKTLNEAYDCCRTGPSWRQRTE